jgi:Protein of unknown function (DUF3311)
VKEALDRACESRWIEPRLLISGVMIAAADLGGIMKLIFLLIPCILALSVPLYNSIPPVLFGIPFFFWFQLVLVPFTSLAILAADRIGKG